MAPPLATPPGEPTNREVAAVLFEHVGGGDWACRLCARVVAQEARKGYTNLRSHLQLRHGDTFAAEYNRRAVGGEATASIREVREAPEVNTEMVEALSRAVEDGRMDAKSAEGRAELLKAVNSAFGALVERIRDVLAQDCVLGLALDAWKQPMQTCSAVVAAVYAVLPPTGNSELQEGANQRNRAASRRVLLLGLSVSPTKNEANAEADALASLASRVCEDFGIDVARRVAFLVGESANLSSAHQELTSGSESLPIIECSNKTLEKAAAAVIRQGNSGDISAARAALRGIVELPLSTRQRLANLSPSFQTMMSSIEVYDLNDGDSDWQRMLKTLNRHHQLQMAVVAATGLHLRDCDRDGLENLLVAAEVKGRLEVLRARLTDIASVAQKLTLRTGAPMHYVRRLFDAIRMRIPGCALAVPVSSPSGIESGVEKVLQDRERSLLEEEKSEMKLLRLDRGLGAEDAMEEDEEYEPILLGGLSFADAAILEAVPPEPLRSKYIDLWWIPSTAMDRSLLFPNNIEHTGSPALVTEMLTMLRYNRELWDPVAVSEFQRAPSGRSGRKRAKKSQVQGEGEKRPRAQEGTTI